MSRKYKFKNPTAAYFVSFATVYWMDVFTRHTYFSILGEAITYCRAEKGMEVFSYCFMPSHVHSVFRSDSEDPSGLLRDFKGFTARKMLKAIEENPQESRKEWLLWMFERAGKKNSNITKRQFWQQHNKPIELWSGKVIKQKIDYIHKNPVEQGFVTDPTHWKYSSARNYGDDETVLKIDNDGIMKAQTDITGCTGTSVTLALAGFIKYALQISSPSFVQKNGAFNLLDIDRYEDIIKTLIDRKFSIAEMEEYIWEVYNKKWLETAMIRGDDVVLWSNPLNPENILKNGNPTFFGREVMFMKENALKYGYDWEEALRIGTLIKK